VLYSGDEAAPEVGTMTTGPKTVEVELTHNELVALLQGARPDSRLLTCLAAASRMQRVKPLGITYFWFSGTGAETYSLLHLAIARAPGAVPRIRQGLLSARARARA
jgi:hypothetical protein